MSAVTFLAPQVGIFAACVMLAVARAAKSEAVWLGSGSLEERRKSFEDCHRDLVAVDLAEPLDSVVALVALFQRRAILAPYRADASVAEELDKVAREMADRLLSIFSDLPQAVDFAVRGFDVHTKFDGTWRTTFPTNPSPPGTRSLTADGLLLAMPSAFRLSMEVGDYDRMNEIAERFPDAFDTLGHRGMAGGGEGAPCTSARKRSAVQVRKRPVLHGHISRDPGRRWATRLDGRERPTLGTTLMRLQAPEIRRGRNTLSSGCRAYPVDRSFARSWPCSPRLVVAAVLPPHQHALDADQVASPAPRSGREHARGERTGFAPRD